ncbi:restriction endonuclease subunit S, partial [Flavobacteriales bacterium]|nr:restriction endonuclease subunit S [Flavobacteriales bacterium]
EKYFGYLFTTPNAKQEFKKQSTGIIDSRLRMYTDSFFNIKTALPPLPEQTAIANFLDYKLEKINRFITKKKQLIELLTEQKAAIINKAVTKGINPNAKLKSSGIEWLGDIPEHWEVRKLKGITDIISKGTTPNTIGKNLLDKGKVKFLKAENIGFNNLVLESPLNFIDEETNSILKRSQLQVNDILFVIAGASIGKVAILPELYTPSNTNQAVSFIRLKDNEYVKFVWYWLQTEFIKQTMWLEAVQSAQPNLAMGKLSNFPVLLPTSQEQKEIVNFIETETSKVEKTISTIEKEITLVEEYKTALIAEAVTGKIDVRDFKVPNTEEPLEMVAEEASNFNKAD